MYNRAGAAGTAGTVLAVPLLSHLTISRRGLYSQGEWHPHGGAQLMNVVHECSSKRPAAHSSCPRTSSNSSPAVCWIHFSI